MKINYNIISVLFSSFLVLTANAESQPGMSKNATETEVSLIKNSLSECVMAYEGDDNTTSNKYIECLYEYVDETGIVKKEEVKLKALLSDSEKNTPPPRLSKLLSDNEVLAVKNAINDCVVSFEKDESGSASKVIGCKYHYDQNHFEDIDFKVANTNDIIPCKKELLVFAFQDKLNLSPNSVLDNKTITFDINSVKNKNNEFLVTVMVEDSADIPTINQVDKKSCKIKLVKRLLD